LIDASLMPAALNARKRHDDLLAPNAECRAAGKLIKSDLDLDATWTGKEANIASATVRTVRLHSIRCELERHGVAECALRMERSAIAGPAKQGGIVRVQA
jgi:hypothetical protein